MSHWPSERIYLTPGEVSTFCSIVAPRLRQTNRPRWRGGCIIHGGTDPNWDVEAETGLSFCHSQCNRGWDVFSLYMELKGIGFAQAKREILAMVGRPEEPRSGRPKDIPDHATVTAIYDYRDEVGQLLMQVLRWEWIANGVKDKTFRQRRPDGRGGWIQAASKRRVLYRLPELVEAPIAFLTEGEKDAEILRQYGFVATTASCGAGAPWLDSYTETLRDKEVIVCFDQDRPGRERAVKILRALVGRVAKLVVLELDDAKDIGAWFETGHSEVELIHIIENAQPARSRKAAA